MLLDLCNNSNNLKITYESNNRLFIHYIYMPAEMVLLMTRNRYFRKNKTAFQSNISLSTNKTCECESGSKYELLTQCILSHQM